MANSDPQKLNKWETNWSSRGFSPPWMLDAVPEPVQRAVAEGFWKPGASILDLGCGDGRIAAWLANQGFRVMGVDFAPSAIRRAQSMHGERAKLKFRVADVSIAGAIPHRFDVLLDRGCLHCLEGDARRQYAINVAHWCKLGGELLLFHVLRAETYDSLVAELSALLGAEFDVRFHRPVQLSRPDAPKPIPGVLLRLTRQGIDTFARAEIHRAPEQCGVVPGAGIRRLSDSKEAHPHWCFPLTDPKWVARADAGFMLEDDPVLCYFAENRAWALPWWVMKNHHVANLDLAGRPVMVSFCELCSAAAAFDPIIGGKRHTFRFGGLYNGTVMPEDHQTGTVWGGFNGTAIEGPLAGTVLQRLPLLVCTWKEWCEMHPDTLVADGTDESRTGHGEGHTPGSPFVNEFMVGLAAFLDTRLPHYELVLGVQAGGESRCYPLAALEQEQCVVNDRLGSEDIVVFARAGSWMACAFRRTLGDQVLAFTGRDGRYFDVDTGSEWDVSGRAIAGPRAGAQLEYVHSGMEEFFIWAAFNPGTSVHGLGAGSGTQREALRLLDAFPPPVLSAMGNGWLRREMTMLVLGDPVGTTAAILAEMGGHVTVVAASQAEAEAMGRRFRGMMRLRIVTQGSATDADNYAAIIDAGRFATLKPAQRAGYIKRLASRSRSGTRVMVLAPLPAGRSLPKREQVTRVFGPSFRLLGIDPYQGKDPSATANTPSVALRFECI